MAMALDRNAYKALKAVVGPENISEDPAVLLGYAFNGMILDPKERGFLDHVPIAVVLPKSTEEVQRIVKVCNRYKVKYKAHSTGFFSIGMPGLDGILMVDLRRMNQLIELDEKNMTAVIEPYVTASQLQAEAMKKGLNCHVVSCGGSHSPLASSTSFAGVSVTGLTTGMNGRNLFGVEWVLPTGEIIRLGSPGSGCGWFTGDGPGPSLRGIMRGFSGACGGLGIFTKIGYKLYPWTGPSVVKRTGTYPQIGWEVPENSKYCYPYWEKWEDVMDAVYKIVDAKVAYHISKVPPDWTEWVLSKSNNDFYKLFKEGGLTFQRKHRMGFNTIVMARTKKEYNYKMKVLEAIVKDTNGKFLPLSREQEEILFGAYIHVNYVARGLRITGSFVTSFGHHESIGLMKNVIEAGEKLIGDGAKPGGKFCDTGAETFWGWPDGGGRYWWQENAFPFDATDEEAVEASFNYFLSSLDIINKGKGKLGVNPFAMGAQATEIFGPQQCNVQEWQRKIKNAFDPHNLSDHTGYISPEPLELPPPPG